MIHTKGAAKAKVHSTCTKTLIFYCILLSNELVEQLYDLLLQIQDVGQAFTVGTIQPIILGFIKACAHELLKKFKVTLEWTRKFIRRHLNWNYQRPTTTFGKVLQDWETQGKLMAYIVFQI